MVHKGVARVLAGAGRDTKEATRSLAEEMQWEYDDEYDDSFDDLITAGTWGVWCGGVWCGAIMIMRPMK